jgi:hypothetical protein
MMIPSCVLFPFPSLASEDLAHIYQSFVSFFLKYAHVPTAFEIIVEQVALSGRSGLIITIQIYSGRVE